MCDTICFSESFNGPTKDKTVQQTLHLSPLESYSLKELVMKVAEFPKLVLIHGILLSLLI